MNLLRDLNVQLRQHAQVATKARKTLEASRTAHLKQFHTEVKHMFYKELDTIKQAYAQISQPNIKGPVENETEV